jgi:RHS repeat-associated protein
MGIFQSVLTGTSAGELQQVTFPYGGCMGWGYVSFEYAGVRTLREAGSRYLEASLTSGGSPTCTNQWNYTISRPDAPNSVIVHSAMTLVDASGVGSKTWNFCTTNSSTCQVGLLGSFVQQASSGGTVLQQDSFQWSQDSTGNSYISQKVTAHEPNGTNPQSAQTNQTLDQYGNVTQSVVYGFNNTSAPIQTYNNTYTYSSSAYQACHQYTICLDTNPQDSPSSSAFASNYVFNRLALTSLTLPGNVIKALALNVYDQGTLTTSSAPSLLDGTVSTARGNAFISATLSSSASASYYDTGSVYNTNSSTGSTATYTALSSSNSYAAPGAIATESYSASVFYNAWMGVTSTTGANGEQLSMTYDSAGRPTSGTSPYGGVTNYTYSTAGALPMTQTETGPNGITITTLDGFGRPIRVKRKDGNGNAQSYQDTVYAPCACSPLGKIQQVSLPYPVTGSSPVYTTYAYDGLGRTLSVQKPDGASTTHYTYNGNVTTVTDPATNTKTFIKDVLGNLLTVVEPDPSNPPSGTVTTSYSYDWMNHVACVDMDRGGTITTAWTYTSNGISCTTVYAANTGTRQTRTFVYSDAGLLTSATNPENGTVAYTYHPTNTLATKTDAKGQTFVYTYDTSNRVTEIQKYPYGQYPNGQEDVCAQVNYTYGTNPYVDPPYSYGRLMSVSTLQTNCPSGTPSYSESYTYGAPGNVLSKTVYASGAPWGSSATINYTYDTFGRTVSIQYPFSYSPSTYSQTTFTTTYDTMGRPSGMTDSSGNTWVNSAGYDYAGRLQTLTTLWSNLETRSYNTLGQLATIGWGAVQGYSAYGPTGTLTYTYSATQNNGQITQATDGLTGETTVYAYDALKRLTSASNSAWNETFSYDGFGNLTGKTLNGMPQSIPVDPSTNRVSGAGYDYNGNMTNGAGATMTYNEDNRMSSAQEPSQSMEYYYYTPDGKRFCRQMAGGDTQYTLYGVHGEALGTYSVNNTATELSVYFGGRRLWQAPYYSPATYGAGALFADRLGSNRYVTSTPASGGHYLANYYPYGDVPTVNVGLDQLGFATYTQDSYTGLDYANQRMYASTYGRFNAPDRMGGKLKDPGSWNRYSYVLGDPVNLRDPNGTCAADTATSVNVCDTNGLLDLDPVISWPGDGYISGPGMGAAVNAAILAAQVAALRFAESAAQTQWNSLSPPCQQALQTGVPNTPVAGMVAALNNATSAESTLVAATAGTSISWTMLAAIGIRETGFNNVPQACPPGVTWGGPTCNGYGIFQITISTKTGVTTAQAGNLTFAAGWATQLLGSNMAALSASFPNFTPTQLLQATAASYNFGTGNISGNPNTIDVGTTGGNYGSNVLGLMSCFH